MYSKLGYAYLAENSPKLAADAFDRALATVKNDPFALAGLARARQALGDTKAASQALGRAMYVWSDAEPGLRWLDEAKAAGIRATPIDVSPGPQRNYRTMGLDKFGPAIWQPFAAPALDARDSTGARVSLDEFKGRNVVLVFYLGSGCPHCVSQIKDLSERSDKWKGLDADVVAVSSDTVASNAASQSSLKYGCSPTINSRTRGCSSRSTISKRCRSTPRCSSTRPAESIGRATAADRSPTTISWLPSSSE